MFVREGRSRRKNHKKRLSTPIWRRGEKRKIIIVVVSHCHGAQPCQISFSNQGAKVQSRKVMAFAETSSYNIAASSLFFYFYPIYYFRPFLSCSLPVVTQSRGHIFLRDRPWRFVHVSPCRPVVGRCVGVGVCFFQQLFDHFFFFNMSLKEYQISGWRKKTPGRMGLIEHVRNISVNGVNVWTFARETCVSCVVGL